MRLNPSPSRFNIAHSELYVAGAYRLKQAFPHVDEALQAFELELRRTPFSAGYQIQVFEGRNIFLGTMPRTKRYPGLRFLFEVEDPRVVCWHISERSLSSSNSGIATVHILNDGR